MKSRHLLEGLRWFLIFLNSAVLILSIIFAPRKGSFGWTVGLPFSYTLNSRELEYVPWILLASLLLSLGIYLFVRGYLRAIEEDQKNDGS